LFAKCHRIHPDFQPKKRREEKIVAVTSDENSINLPLVSIGNFMDFAQLLSATNDTTRDDL